MHQDTRIQNLVFPEDYCPGSSAAMTSLYQEMGGLSRGGLSVLIHGETGVGKEPIARILQASSTRSDAPFVAINCAAIPRDLLEAEMFGVARGVATGVEKRPGMFETADGGTLFLDEVGELAPTLQAKLLRALQEKEIQPVGGRPRKIDVRVIAATNVDLDPRSGRGGLRQDLYYRLAAWVLEVPPLRRRRDDIPDLVRYFLRRGAVEAGVRPPEIDAAALRRLEAYDWPGNVRELEHEMRRIVLRAGGAVRIGVANLDPRLRATAPGDGVSSDGLDGLALAPRLEALERKLIQEALRRTGGHKLEAARLLEISRNGLAKKLERLEMKKSWASDESAA